MKFATLSIQSDKSNISNNNESTPHLPHQKHTSCCHSSDSSFIICSATSWFARGPGVSTWSIMPTTLHIQPPIHHQCPSTSPLMFVVHCIASVRVMMIGMERKTIVPLTWFPRQTTLAENSDKQRWYYIAILALKRQKPPTNALDGLYLPCADHMLQVRWVEVTRCIGWTFPIITIQPPDAVKKVRYISWDEIRNTNSGHTSDIA